jgi:hypothetical protein
VQQVASEDMKWFIRLLSAVGCGIACSVLMGVFVFRLSIRGISFHLEALYAYILVFGVPTALAGLCAYRVADWLLRPTTGPPADDQRPPPLSPQ